MKILNTTDIEELINILNSGGIIAFPTDTVYGLGCRYDLESAINKIKKAKGRDANKPLPMMCCSLEQMARVAYLGEDAIKIAAEYMPGPLTMILNKKSVIEDYITNGFSTIGIRIPDDDFILEMINDLGCPMLVTSANISNMPSLFSGEEVEKDFADYLDAIVMGVARGNEASTIIDMTDEIKLIRKGPIDIDELRGKII